MGKRADWKLKFIHLRRFLDDVGTEQLSVSKVQKICPTSIQPSTSGGLKSANDSSALRRGRIDREDQTATSDTPNNCLFSAQLFFDPPAVPD